MVITIPSNSATPSSTQMGQSSFLLHERATQHFWAGTGALSIKTFAHGSAFYDLGRGQYRVEPHAYLLLNQGQWYSIACESEQPIESFCLFFADGLAEEAQYALTSTMINLLDNPQPAHTTTLNFFEKLYAHDEVLSPALSALKTSYAAHIDDPEWLREQMYGILQRMLLVHEAVCREVEILPALRATTREELYRRLHRAKDFMASCFERPLTINEIAGVACLSPNHFLRTFQQAFRQTPHQYLTAQRLQRAQNLLRNSELSVTDICFAVGFASLGSFSSLFKRRVGVSPEQFRRAKK